MEEMTRRVAIIANYKLICITIYHNRQTTTNIKINIHGIHHMLINL
jgi:hypothetical protein